MTDDRTGYTAGLRALADLLDAHPEVPLPYHGSTAPLTIMHLSGADQRTKFLASVRAFPGHKTKEARDAYFDVEVMLHGLSVQITANRDAVCERVVTGTRVLYRDVPDPEALAAVPTTTVTETVEDVRWDCRPLLAPESVPA